MGWILVLSGIILILALGREAFNPEALHNTRFLCKVGVVLTAALVGWSVYYMLQH